MRALTLDVIREHRCAEHQDQVAPLKRCHDAGAVRGQEAGEQRMLLGKAVARGQRAYPDRGLVLFGQGDDFLPRPIARNRGTDDEDRALCGGEPRGRARAAGQGRRRRYG